MLKKEIVDEEAEELRAQEEASRQITPITQITGWTESHPAVREPMYVHHLIRPHPTTVTQEGRPIIPTELGSVQPVQPIETFTQFTEVSGVLRPGQTIPGQHITSQLVWQPTPLTSNVSRLAAGQPTPAVTTSKVIGGSPAPSVTRQPVHSR